MKKSPLHADRTIQPDGNLHGVVVACRDDAGRWLLIRRSEHVAAPLAVCFPGGGIDGQESQADAVVREMREELGATVRPGACVWEHRYEDRAVTLWGWCAELTSRSITPDPAEVAEVLWLTSREVIEHPDIMPATRFFIEALEQHLAN